MQIRVVLTDDYSALYISNKLVTENHVLETDVVISKVANACLKANKGDTLDFQNRYIEGEVLEDKFLSQFPETFEEIEEYCD